MNKPKIILLNGGKGSGKTELKDELMLSAGNLKPSSCKDRVIELTQSLFNIPDSLFWLYYNDRNTRETFKAFSITASEFNRLQRRMGIVEWLSSDFEAPVGITLRQAMIYTAECVIKPMFGEGYFSKYRAEHLLNGHVYIDDSFGFAEELPALIERCGVENILLVNIVGRGSYGGDSRKPVNGDEYGLTSVVLDSSVELNEFLRDGVIQISDWL